MTEVLQTAKAHSESFKKKADHNKRESLTCFIAILLASLSAPLFITLGNGDFWSKAVPSVLSVIAAGLTSWLQLRKPQKLWSMYRSAQRLIEHNIMKYNFKTDEYETHEHPEKLLASKVADIALSAHNEWINVIPTPEAITLNRENT